MLLEPKKPDYFKERNHSFHHFGPSPFANCGPDSQPKGNMVWAQDPQILILHVVGSWEKYQLFIFLYYLISPLHLNNLKARIQRIFAQRLVCGSKVENSSKRQTGILSFSSKNVKFTFSLYFLSYFIFIYTL